MHNLYITIEGEPYTNREVTVTEDVSYGILHCEHVYYFVMPPNSNCIDCTSVIDGEQCRINDPDEIDDLLNKFCLTDIFQISNN